MPRSPTRDLSDRFAGRRDYYQKWDWIRRWKYLLSAIALVVTVGWACVDWFLPSHAAITHTHGSLVHSHSAWDADCQACHKTRTDPASFRAALCETQHRWREWTCEKCHRGTIHHETALPANSHEDCAACHHDHQGRDASLTRITDTHC